MSKEADPGSAERWASAKFHPQASQSPCDIPASASLTPPSEIGSTVVKASSEASQSARQIRSLPTCPNGRVRSIEIPLGDCELAYHACVVPLPVSSRFLIV